MPAFTSLRPGAAGYLCRFVGCLTVAGYLCRFVGSSGGMFAPRIFRTVPRQTGDINTRHPHAAVGVQGMYEIRHHQLHPGYGTVPKVIDQLVAGCAPPPRRKVENNDSGVIAMVVSCLHSQTLARWKPSESSRVI